MCGCRIRRAFACGACHPMRGSCKLAEGPVPGDSTSTLPEVPPINGYGGTGDVTGESGVRELRTDRGLRDARLVRRVGPREDRGGPLRPLVSRDQGA